MISFSCPSRGRPSYAKRLIDTAEKFAKTDVEIMFYLNEDDPTLPEYRDLLQIKIKTTYYSIIILS